MDDFKLYLTVIEDGKEYKYFCNENETDENANTKLYCNNELLSDNYFAYNDLMETIIKIYNKELTEFTMSESMKYNYTLMIKTGWFEE